MMAEFEIMCCSMPVHISSSQRMMAEFEIMCCSMPVHHREKVEIIMDMGTSQAIGLGCL